jgi:UDP-N-acetylmuramate dehydrogenase
MILQGFRGELRENEPLRMHTSFRIGGPVDALAIPADRADLSLLLRELRSKKTPYFVLGGGTNLLVRDGGFRGVAISLGKMKAINVERQYRSIGGSYAVVRAEAGASLGRLLAFSVNEGLTGLEFSAGIPGTIGGAICMNAGAAGGEIGDVVESVTVLTPGGGETVLGKNELRFGYRTAAIPEGCVVLDACMILRKEDQASVAHRVKELMEQRANRQPSGFANAGSIFKNPQDVSAGKLIEDARLKGSQVGGAEISERHANFIVNRGTAKAADVLALMDKVTKSVLEQHGVRLEPEIKIIGED